MYFCTDASRNSQLRCGGVCGEEYFIMQWKEDFIEKEQPSIAYLELYGLAVGILSWIPKFKNKKICIHCDNQSVVNMVNKTTSKCKNCMVLIQLIVLFCLSNNVKVKISYIKSAQNVYADHLSRMRYDLFRKQARLEGRYFNGKPTPIPDILYPIDKIWLPLSPIQVKGKRRRQTGKQNQLHQRKYRQSHWRK